MGKALTVTLGVIAVGAVITLILFSTGFLDPIISQVTNEPNLSISETHGEDLWLRAEIHIYVTNDGGASASGVTVTVGYSGGSETKTLGDVAEGQTKTADFTFVMVDGGDYTFHVTTTCLEGKSDSITFAVHVQGF